MRNRVTRTHAQPPRLQCHRTLRFQRVDCEQLFFLQGPQVNFGSTAVNLGARGQRIEPEVVA